MVRRVRRARYPTRTAVHGLNGSPTEDTGFFYGSAYVEFPTLEDAERVVERCRDVPPRVGGRLSRVNFAPARAKDEARAGHRAERPPVPIAPGR